MHLGDEIRRLVGRPHACPHLHPNRRRNSRDLPLRQQWLCPDRTAADKSSDRKARRGPRDQIAKIREVGEVRRVLADEYRAVLRFLQPWNLSHSHGISEAWITSATPSPPTERMARSTSSSPKRWVVISSSGKRLEASCAKASSQAL